MDCANILEILDCVRPNSGDLELLDFADARTHLAECETCRCEFESRQQFDRAVATVVQDVPVPQGLEHSLLGVLTAEPATDHREEALKKKAAGEPAVAGGIHTRWQTRLSLAALACTAAIALAVTYWPREPDQFSVVSLLERSIADWKQVEHLEEFVGEPAPYHPAGFRHRDFVWGSRFYGRNLDSDPAHDMAVTRFNYNPRAFGLVKGVVVAIPAERVSELPTAGDFSRAPLLYPNPSGFAAAAVTWSDGKTVFICFVPRRQAPALEHLQRELRGTTV